jgi:hypothetical protein
MIDIVGGHAESNHRQGKRIIRGEHHGNVAGQSDSSDAGEVRSSEGTLRA